MKTIIISFLFIVLAGCAYPNIGIKNKEIVGLPAKKNNEIRVHTFNIGVGSCHLIECANSQPPIMYDCGSSGLKTSDKEFDELRNKINSILKKNNDLIRVVLSHPHSDHQNLLERLIRNGSGQPMLGRARIVSFWHGGEISKTTNSIYNAKKILEGFPEYVAPPWGNGKKLEGVAEVKGLSCGTQNTYAVAANTYIKNKFYNSNSVTNAESLSLMISNGPDSNVLLTGDSIGSTQKEIVKNINNLKESKAISRKNPIATLVSPHHGSSSNSSNNAEFAKAIQPRSVVYSAGNWYGHPKCSVTNNYFEFLDKAKGHEFKCGRNWGFGMALIPGLSKTTSTQRAEYVTKSSGDIITTVGPAKYSFDCSEDNNC